MLSSVTALLLSVHLASAPTEPAAPKPAPAEAPRPRAITLAAPGFSTVNVTPEMATFLNDHFAQQLTLQGLRVITSNEVQALVGLERQKQLLGCTEQDASCMAEVANALGADGLVTASVGKFGDSYQVNTKIIGADGKPLTVSASRVTGDTAVLDELTRVARAASSELKSRLGRTGGSQDAPLAVSSTAGTRRPPGKAVSATNIPTGHFIAGVGAMVLGGLGALSGLGLVASGEGRVAGGLLLTGLSVGLGVGGWYILEAGRHQAQEDARRNALVTELQPGALERAQERLPAVQTTFAAAVTFP